MLSAINRLHVSYALNLENRALSEVTKKACDLSQRMLFSSQTDKELPQPALIMNEEEFLKHRMNSDKNYLARMRKAFPTLSDQKIQEAYIDGCRLAYKDYKKSSPNEYSDLGLIFRTDDFIDPKTGKDKA